MANKVPPANQRMQISGFPSGTVAEKQLGEDLAQGLTGTSYTNITYLNF